MRLIAICLIALGYALCPSTLTAQANLHQIIVVKGGAFGDPSDNVSLATVQPDLTGYTEFAEIKTEAAQDITIRDNHAWVAALDSLVLYDIDSYVQLAAVALPGVNKIEPFGDYLLVGRGFGAGIDFLQVLDAYDLSWVTNIPVSAETAGIAITPERAYVAIPGDFYSTTGRLAVVDLVNLSLIEEIDLGADGHGIGAVFHQSGIVIAICGGSGNLLAVRPEAGTWKTKNLGTIASYAGAVRNGNKLYFQYGGFFDADLGVFDLTTKSTENAILIPGAYAEVQIDPVSGNIYRTTTDFFSTGTLERYDATGLLLNDIPVGISPEQVGLDIRGNCNPPRNVSLNLTPSSVNIFWNPAAGATAYRVLIREEGGALTTIPSMSGDAIPTTPGLTYQYALQSICGTTQSAYSAVRKFTSPIAKPVSETTDNSYHLYSSTGQLVRSGNSEQISLLQFEDLPAGLYLLESAMITKRILVP